METLGFSSRVGTAGAAGTAARAADSSAFGSIARESAARRVREAASRDALSHALMITGPGDRLALARYAAAALECSGSGTRPCGTCSHCRKVLRDIHPDVVTVRDEEHAALSAEVVRSVRADAWIAPNEGARKVYLFPDCSLLTERDQNILLKVVEEGPPRAAFLFCAESPGQLLQTLRSRCVELRLPAQGSAAAHGSVGGASDGGSGQGGGASGRQGGNASPARGGASAAKTGRASAARTARGQKAAAQESVPPAERGEALCRCAVRGGGAAAEYTVHLEREHISREELREMLNWCRGAYAAALFLPYGRTAEAEYRETALFLTNNLTKRQIASTIEILGKYAGACGWNVGANHVLGALAVELEGLR